MRAVIDSTLTRPTYPIRRLVLWTVAVIGLSASSAGAVSPALQSILDDPVAARAFDYCDWRFAGGGAEGDLPDFEDLLAPESQESRGAAPTRATILARAGTEVALAANATKDCARAFKQGSAADAKAFGRAEKRFASRKGSKPSGDPKLADVQTRIRALWIRDQAARMVYVGTQPDSKGADRWARGLAVERAVDADTASYDTMHALLEDYDWFDIQRFGEDISSNAWILVQHADDHPAFQAMALARMEPYLETGGVKKGDYAYLYDRVAVNHDRKQRYGTQPDWECANGTMQLRPLEDPEAVDALRAEMGLGTAADGLAEMNRSVCGG